jgi:hypothetical protein
MPKSSIPLEPELSDTATLRQAVLWVAFDLPPLKPEFEQAHRQNMTTFENEYPPEEAKLVAEAKKLIFTALRKGELKATAAVVGCAKIDPYNDWPERDYRGQIIMHQGHSPDYVSVIGRSLWKFNDISFEDSYMLYYLGFSDEDTDPDRYVADGITISAADFFRVFPPHERRPQTDESHAKSDYLPPYIDLMLRAIRELGITPDNQPVKKVIEAWLLDNAPAGGLSGRDIQAMATFIRLPEKKKGGSGGDNRSKTVPKTKNKTVTNKSK